MKKLNFELAHVRNKGVFVLLSFFLLLGCTQKATKQQKQLSQYPSPMVETTRAHERIAKDHLPGVDFTITDCLAKPVEVYIPEHRSNSEDIDLLIHFHGTGYVAKHAVFHSEHAFVLAVVNLGSGSSAYEKPFVDQAIFPNLIAAIRGSVGFKINRIYLSSFSAGYGAVRALLKNHMQMLDGIILLDGLHTDYVPDRVVLAQGGALNTTKLADFVKFAQFASKGEKRFLITHSEIFPGTYASTTETADYLIDTLHLQRRPELKWGPLGMQRVSEVQEKGLKIFGYAGNTAPDHVDHLHGLGYFLMQLMAD
ncbi:MAG: hypothetical protein H6696_01835 [Deferribacteres bacterium]|nr:hypothetical protein [candidate division KSB1 bacterium]MCB9500652.1 hypothetical protein [Deferribacteres bacterium]